MFDKKPKTISLDNIQDMLQEIPPISNSSIEKKIIKQHNEISIPIIIPSEDKKYLEDRFKGKDIIWLGEN